MAKVTSKYQVTIPKSLAEERGIKPGDDIKWTGERDSIRITPLAGDTQSIDSIDERLKLFDQSTARQRRRQKRPSSRTRTRGWTREDLYDRGRSR